MSLECRHYQPHSKKDLGARTSNQKLESHIQCCPALAGRTLDEHITVSLLIQSCVEELPDKLHMSSKDMSYKEVRAAVCPTSRGVGSPLSLILPPLDIGNKQEDTSTECGEEVYPEESQVQTSFETALAPEATERGPLTDHLGEEGRIEGDRKANAKRERQRKGQESLRRAR